MGYTVDTPSKEEYFSQLRNIHKIQKLNEKQIELAKKYIFIDMKLARIPSNLIPPHGTAHVEEKKFWERMTKLLDEYSSKNDLLNKFMKIQEKNNDVHTIDYRLVEKTKEFKIWWKYYI